MSDVTTEKAISSKPKAERTRAAILAAAENHFSRVGYAATRLEDIAEELGMTRAALFYYYKDKQMLYEAMIADAFGELTAKLETLLDAGGSVAKRIESATAAWVDAVMARPSLARLIMRFVADGFEQPVRRIFVNNEELPIRYFQLFEEGRKSGELNPLHDDPFHAASAILGTTVFYAAAMSALVPDRQFQPLDPEQAVIHRREALHSARRLLGIKNVGRKSTIK
jgi:TetR/AcrR family transcriptional regulator